MDYFLKYTGIPINFGIVVVLGFVIGIAIAGQTFYNFTLDHLKYLGTFKAMGASNKLLAKLAVTQALVVGSIGWGLVLHLFLGFFYKIRCSRSACLGSYCSLASLPFF